MSSRDQPFASQVSAVLPLKGDVIDGTPRPKRRRERKPPREPLDRSLTFFCSNPQCEHGTWSPVEQARHMAREFWEVTRALVRLAPDSPEALKLTGGVILRDLSDDECRDAAMTWDRMRRDGGAAAVPLDIRLASNECHRRVVTGRLQPLTPDELAERRRQRNAAERREWESLGEEEVRSAGVRAAYLRSQGLPVPEDIRLKGREYQRRLRDGRMTPLTQEERSVRATAHYLPGRASWSEEEVRQASREHSRLRRKGLPVPEDIRQMANEFRWRVKTGKIPRGRG